MHAVEAQSKNSWMSFVWLCLIFTLIPPTISRVVFFTTCSLTGMVCNQQSPVTHWRHVQLIHPSSSIQVAFFDLHFVKRNMNEMRLRPSLLTFHRPQPPFPPPPPPQLLSLLLDHTLEDCKFLPSELKLRKTHFGRFEETKRLETSESLRVKWSRHQLMQ